MSASSRAHKHVNELDIGTYIINCQANRSLNSEDGRRHMIPHVILPSPCSFVNFIQLFYGSIGNTHYNMICF